MFDPGLGVARAGFFFSRYGLDFRAVGSDPANPRKNKRREEFPAPDGGTYSGEAAEVKANRVENGPKPNDFGP